MLGKKFFFHEFISYLIYKVFGCQLINLHLRVRAGHKVLTYILYIEYRAVSGVFRTIDPPPPLHPASVSSREGGPPPKAGRGYTLVGRWGGGGLIFRKTPDIGLASYSTYNTSTELSFWDRDISVVKSCIKFWSMVCIQYYKEWPPNTEYKWPYCISSLNILIQHTFSRHSTTHTCIYLSYIYLIRHQSCPQ